MSLIRPVIRMCAVKALMDNTWAEQRVYDSDQTPLAEALTSDAKPYICVYTDEDNRTELGARDFYGADRQLSLTLELGLAAAVLTGSGIAEIKIPATDEGMECAVDILESQAIKAMLGDPFNEWAELLRRMILKVVRAPSHRGGSSDKGIRWAARRVQFVCDVISDPPPGIVLPAGHPVRDFIALAEEQSPSMGAVAVIIKSLLNEEEVPSWRQAQAWLTMTQEEIEATGLAPLYIPVTESPVSDEPPVLDDVTLEDEDTDEDLTPDNVPEI